ncbi:MAG: tRNA lysidine(34) synthetase TilS [Bacteriovoracaceae bacterium]|nr:tRNA lysidine(34) synthetase TilS [Bacteriovoracaceae bacterium]
MESSSLVSDKSLLKWVGSFIEKHDLAKPDSKVVCALSGGPDSMLLSHICEGLKNQGLLKSVRHIHIDHGLRPSSGKEAFKLKGWCEKWGWDFTLKKVTGEPPASNIENWARKVRRHLLLSELKTGEVLFLGHHIDDSFEWFIRQTLASSQGPFAQGIPLVNGLVRRPFHCLSRKQIERFVSEFNLPCILDYSNEDERFQRNAIRKQVKPNLLKMFPKGMAHYVERSNQWAHKEGKHVFDELRPVDTPVVARFALGSGVVCLNLLIEERWEVARADILQTLKDLSTKERGSLRQNVSKLFETLEEGKMRGPLHFSGGVRIYIYPGTLLFMSVKGEEEFLTWISKTTKRIQKASDIPRVSIQGLKTQLQQLGGLPFVAFKGKTFGLEGLKKDPLFQDLIDELKSIDFYFRPLRHLELAALKSDRTNQAFQSFVLLR